MNTKLKCRASRLAMAALWLAWAHAASAQTFSSGSTGADGAFSPTVSQSLGVRPGGVYHYTTVNIPAGVTVSYFRGADNSPVVILATGAVTISGTISVSGDQGNIGGCPVAGARGGPGGFNGGMSGSLSSVPTAGEGPAGGQPSTGSGGNGGLYGAPQSLVGLTPLFGGSGGGGPAFVSIVGCASGSGGGGAILIASSASITVNGVISANGGNSTATGAGCSLFGGGGAGGAIRLVANTITGANTGLISALGGSAGGSCPNTAGGVGRIRLEANSFTNFLGQTNPVPSVVNAPGAVSAGGSPALVNVPSLSIASIGGLSVPGATNASYSVPDLTLAPGTANPIPVVVNVSNTPVGAPTQITVRVIPRSPGTATNVNVPPTEHGGSFASSTATANVTLLAGQVSLLQAFATMTLTGQLASLFPLIDGEPVERVKLAADLGEASTLSLVTASGREVNVEQLRAEDRIRVAQAWDVMKATQAQ
jgi:hypothetical protein